RLHRAGPDRPVRAAPGDRHAAADAGPRGPPAAWPGGVELRRLSVRDSAGAGPGTAAAAVLRRSWIVRPQAAGLLPRPPDQWGRSTRSASGLHNREPLYSTRRPSSSRSRRRTRPLAARTAWAVILSLAATFAGGCPSTRTCQNACQVRGSKSPRIIS